MSGEEIYKKLTGLCIVNGVALSNLSRYLYANHPEGFSKRELQRVKKHLKDCPACRKDVNSQKQGDV